MRAEHNGITDSVHLSNLLYLDETFLLYINGFNTLCSSHSIKQTNREQVQANTKIVFSHTHTPTPTHTRPCSIRLIQLPHRHLSAWQYISLYIIILLGEQHMLIIYYEGVNGGRMTLLFWHPVLWKQLFNFERWPHPGLLRYTICTGILETGFISKFPVYLMLIENAGLQTLGPTEFRISVT